MMRLVMGLAAALGVAMSGGTVYAKMVMQTFPVLAGAGPHDVYLRIPGEVARESALMSPTIPI